MILHMGANGGIFNKYLTYVFDSRITVQYCICIMLCRVRVSTMPPTAAARKANWAQPRRRTTSGVEADHASGKVVRNEDETVKCNAALESLCAGQKRRECWREKEDVFVYLISPRRPRVWSRPWMAAVGDGGEKDCCLATAGSDQWQRSSPRVSRREVFTVFTCLISRVGSVSVVRVVCDSRVF